jgi:hypothetical protein
MGHRKLFARRSVRPAICSPGDLFARELLASAPRNDWGAALLRFELRCGRLSLGVEFAQPSDDFRWIAA